MKKIELRKMVRPHPNKIDETLKQILEDKKITSIFGKVTKIENDKVQVTWQHNNVSLWFNREILQ